MYTSYQCGAERMTLPATVNDLPDAPLMPEVAASSRAQDTYLEGLLPPELYDLLLKRHDCFAGNGGVCCRIPMVTVAHLGGTSVRWLASHTPVYLRHFPAITAWLNAFWAGSAPPPAGDLLHTGPLRVEYC